MSEKLACHLTMTAALNVAAVNSSLAKDESTTADDKWQPTNGTVRTADYVGPDVCITCHRGHAKQMGSGMGQSVPSHSAKILGGHPELSWERGPYTYTVRNDGGKATFSVADGKTKITEPVFTVEGSGTTFQAYLIQHNRQYQG